MNNLIGQLYHEKQQEGSMLCAQHALNSLLQGPFFSAPDLASIANHLDEVERAVRDPVAPGRSGPRSTNMDDTGFFSVQVLENALRVWGLTLVRWRSEELRPFQDSPELQPAFILNLDQHWYTLRRFGHPNQNFHWFNLNSSSKSPEWISNTYLGMTLQQAEQEGYSVFAIRPLDDESPNAENPLPECVADNVAVGVLPVTSNPTLGHTAAGGANPVSDYVEDEDLDLQRVLQESLQGARDHDVFATTAFEEDVGLPDEAFAAFQASAARQRETLAQAKREQEMAMQESMESDAAMAANQRRTAGEEEEEEMIRQALAESLAASTSGPMEPDPLPPRTSATDPAGMIPATGAASTQAPRPLGARVLDDEDEELQAALRASLEHMPSGFMVPDSPPPSRPSNSQPTSTRNVPRIATPPPLQDDDESMASASAPPSPLQEKQLDVEEMRRQRLARFGN